MSFKTLGLKADSSCIPGRQRKDREKFFDWSKAKNCPYFPSDYDYQEEDEVKKIFRDTHEYNPNKMCI